MDEKRDDVDYVQSRGLLELDTLDLNTTKSIHRGIKVGNTTITTHVQGWYKLNFLHYAMKRWHDNRLLCP